MAYKFYWTKNKYIDQEKPHHKEEEQKNDAKLKEAQANNRFDRMRLANSCNLAMFKVQCKQE